MDLLLQVADVNSTLATFLLVTVHEFPHKSSNAALHFDTSISFSLLIRSSTSAGTHFSHPR